MTKLFLGNRDRYGFITASKNLALACSLKSLQLREHKFSDLLWNRCTYYAKDTRTHASFIVTHKVATFIKQKHPFSTKINYFIFVCMEKKTSKISERIFLRVHLDCNFYNINCNFIIRLGSLQFRFLNVEKFIMKINILGTFVSFLFLHSSWKNCCCKKEIEVYFRVKKWNFIKNEKNFRCLSRTCVKLGEMNWTIEILCRSKTFLRC